MAIFRHNGIAFNYEDIGDGLPVVFCHGLGGDLNQPKELIGRLQTRRLIVWDCRAHGRTKLGCSSAKLCFSTFAADLHALLKHLSIPRTTLGGISMGAGIAISYALRWPTLIDGLVLVRPAWLNLQSPPNLRLFQVVGECLGETSSVTNARRQLLHDKDFERLRLVSEDSAGSLLSQFDKPNAVTRRRRLLDMPLSVPFERISDLKHLHIPVLIVGVKGDPLHPYEYAERYAQLLPQSRFLEIPSKAHGIDKHYEAFRNCLRDFIIMLDTSTSSGNAPPAR